jgi:hypothetical protein
MKKLQVSYTLGLMWKVLGPYYGVNKNYKASFSIWKLHPKVSSWGVVLKNKNDDPKFQFSYMKLGNDNHVKNVFM